MKQILLILLILALLGSANAERTRRDRITETHSVQQFGNVHMQAVIDTSWGRAYFRSDSTDSAKYALYGADSLVMDSGEVWISNGIPIQTFIKGFPSVGDLFFNLTNGSISSWFFMWESAEFDSVVMVDSSHVMIAEDAPFSYTGQWSVPILFGICDSLFVAIKAHTDSTIVTSGYSSARP